MRRSGFDAGAYWKHYAVEPQDNLQEKLSVMLMSGVIVDDEMEIQPQRGLTVYLAQEFEELLVAMATETFANDSSLKER